ncbi:unnamed protein product [Aspergillus oryzae]|nr:unnamed protein product [Aspergillus oryzae]
MIEKSDHSEWAYRVISWVFYARRPLSVDELTEALAAQTQRGNNCLDMNYAPPDIQIVISYCSGLIVANSSTEKIEFVHLTAYQYFEENHHEHPWIAKSLKEISLTCLRFLQNPSLTSSADQMFPANEHTYISLSLLMDGSQESGATGLHLVARFGLVTQLRDLLKEIPVSEINSRDPYGQTPLVLAVRHGHWDIINVILDDSNVDPNLSDDDGRSPLSIASQLGYSSVVEKLLSTGETDLNLPAFDGWSPLMYASRGNHTEIIKLLLADKKIHANFTSPDGQTALKLAVEMGFTDVVRLLLESGRVETNPSDSTSRDTFMTALENGDKDIIYLLLEYGYTNAIETSTLPSSAGLVPTVGLICRSSSLFTYDGSPETRRIFWMAVEKGFVDMVLLLLRTGKADPNLTDSAKKSALMLAVENKHKEVVEALLCVAPHADPIPGLQAAISMKQIATIRSFLGIAGVDPNTQDRVSGQTALMAAIQAQDLQFVQALLENKMVDINAQNWAGGTALMLAVWFKDLDAVELLVGHGADPNPSLRSWDGVTLRDLSDQHGVKRLLSPKKVRTF